MNEGNVRDFSRQFRTPDNNAVKRVMDYMLKIQDLQRRVNGLQDAELTPAEKEFAKILMDMLGLMSQVQPIIGEQLLPPRKKV